MPPRTDVAICHIRVSPGRSKSAAANMPRSHGPISRAGARTTICKPTRHFASAAGRYPLSENRPPIRKRWGSRCAIPAARPRLPTFTDGAKARTFFEEHFLPLRISRLGEDDGFVTGYYEPVIDGSRTRDRRLQRAGLSPPFQSVRPRLQAGSCQPCPTRAQVFRKIGRRKLVPYYDRAEIEDGAIAGRGLEICWLKNQTDLLFTQIQGSARVRLEDGSTIRINYDAHNGYPYTRGRPHPDRSRHHPAESRCRCRRSGNGWSKTPTAPRNCGGRTGPTCSFARCSSPTRMKRWARRAFR